MSFFNRRSHGFCWDYLWLLVVHFLIKKGNNLMVSMGRNNTLELRPTGFSESDPPHMCEYLTCSGIEFAYQYILEITKQ